MPDASMPSPHHNTARAFAKGIIGAAAAALLISLSPVLTFAVIAIGVVAGAIGVAAAGEARIRHLAALAGFLIGSGSLFLLISVSAIFACGRTADFCGDANPTPSLAIGVVLAILGCLAATGVVRANRRSDSGA